MVGLGAYNDEIFSIQHRDGKTIQAWAADGRAWTSLDDLGTFDRPITEATGLDFGERRARQGPGLFGLK